MRYYQQPDDDVYRTQGGWGGGRFMSVVTKLIIVNVALFVVQILAEAIASKWAGPNNVIWDGLALTPWLAIRRGFVWQFVTYAFLHGGIMHILLNMYFLYMFGREIEAYWGKRKFLAFYLGAAAFSGLSYAVAQAALGVWNIPCIGASGAIFAIMAVYAMYWPHRKILVMFIFPMPIWAFVAIAAFIEVMALRGINESGVATMAHIGGLLFGFVFVQMERRFPGLRLPSVSGLLHRFQPSEEALQRREDEILGRIHREGIQTLSGRERRFLQKRSQERRR